MGAVMTPFPHAIDIDAPLTDARRMMVEHEIRHLPVKEDGKLVGLVTDRDLKLVASLRPQSSNRAGEIRVRSACVFDVYTAKMSTPVTEVAAEMHRRRIGSTLITKEGRLAGIFTANDACRVLTEVLGGSIADPPRDQGAA